MRINKIKLDNFKYDLFPIFAVIIVILVNLIMSNITIKKDFTKNKIFSFSEQTIKVINSINKNVTIYALYNSGYEDPFSQEILERYCSKSDYIDSKKIDPLKNPSFIDKYDKEGTGIQSGSYIFECDNKYKVIHPFELINYDSNGKINSTSIEQKFTSALVYVSSKETPLVCFTSGHGEYDIKVVNDFIKRENYKCKKINLLSEEIPKDTDLVIIASPEKDFDSSEIKKLDNFFDLGGDSLVLMDVKNSKLENFNTYLKEWGIVPRGDLVLEGDKNKFYQSPTYIMPEILLHDITKNLIQNRLITLAPVATSLNILFKEKDNIKVYPLLKTSDNSYGKVNPSSPTLDREDNDNEGPLIIAAVADRKNFDENFNQISNTRLLIIGSMGFASDEVLSISGHANIDFIMNGINWITDSKDKIYIRPKSLKKETLKVASFSQLTNISIFVTIVIPVIILIIGFIVWLRRRYL